MEELANGENIADKETENKTKPSSDKDADFQKDKSTQSNKKSNNTTENKNVSDVERKPLSEIQTDEKRFQGRKKLNETVVNNIATNFSDKDQDPIHIWTDPKNGKTYVLSGHHRYYGAKRAGRSDVKVIDRTHDFTEEQAMRFAKEEANANRSMETPFERANTLRQKRERGEDTKEFLEREGRNKNLVNNLSHLNPNGKTVQALLSFDSTSESDSKREMEKIADWIGEVMRLFKDFLTPSHENEMFDFLKDKDKSKRFTNKREFAEKIGSLIGLTFDRNEPLNLARVSIKGVQEQQWEKDVKELEEEIGKYEKQITDLDNRFTDPNMEGYISPDTKNFDKLKELASKRKAELREEQKVLYERLADLKKAKRDYIKADASIGNLFGDIDFQKSEDYSYLSDRELKDEIQRISDEIKNDIAGTKGLLERSKARINHPLYSVYKELTDLKTERYQEKKKKQEEYEKNNPRVVYTPKREALKISAYSGERVVYHGTKENVANKIVREGIKFGSELSDTDWRGGGYDVTNQESFSTSLNPNISKHYSGEHKVGIVKLEINPNANVVTVENEIYAEDLQDYSKELEGVDAVYLKNSGEEELVILNKEAVKVVEAKSFKVSENVVRFQKNKNTPYKKGKISQQAFDQLIAKLKKPFAKAFKNINILTDWEAFERKAEEYRKKKNGGTDFHIGAKAETDVEYMRTPSGVIYGAKLPDGTIYINPEHLNANTPIHEFGHLWEQLMPQRFAEGVKLFQNTPIGKKIFAQLKKNKGYKNYSDEKLWSEALVTYIGDKGEQLYHSSRKDKFIDWIKDFFKEIGAKLYSLSGGKIGKDFSPSDHLSKFTNRVLGDLMGGKELQGESGKNILSQVQMSVLSPSDFDSNGNVRPEVLAEIQAERESIIKQAKANGTYMKAPNGKPTNLNEEQWAMVRTQRFKDWFGDWEKDPENSSKVVDDNGEPLVVYHGTNAEFNVFDLNFSGTSTDVSFYGTGAYFSNDKKISKLYGEGVKSFFLNIKNFYNADEELKPLYEHIKVNDLNDSELFSFDDNFTIKDLEDLVHSKMKDVQLEISVDRSRDRYEVYSSYRGEYDYNPIIWFNTLEEAKKYIENHKEAESYHIAKNRVLKEYIKEGNYLGYDYLRYDRISDVPHIFSKTIKRLGYDGVIGDDTAVFHFGNKKEFVVFHPNQIKSATDNVGTYSEGSDDIRYHKGDSQSVNDVFNTELQQLRDGELPVGHIFQLGTPNAILQSAGLPNLPIELSSERLKKKSSENYKKNHPFDLESIKNLPSALQNPIMIFNNPNNDGKVVLTELKHNGVNHIVALKVRTKKGVNEVDFQVNNIATVFPKDRIEEVAEWIFDTQQDRKAYFNKEKSLAWLSDNGTTLRLKGYNTKDIANVINNFQNPKIKSDNDIDYQIVGEQKPYFSVLTTNREFNQIMRQAREGKSKQAFLGAIQNSEWYSKLPQDEKERFADTKTTKELLIFQL